MMFGVGPATRVYLAAGVTDMRKGFEGVYGRLVWCGIVCCAIRSAGTCSYSRMRNAIV